MFLNQKLFLGGESPLRLLDKVFAKTSSRVFNPFYDLYASFVLVFTITNDKKSQYSDWSFPSQANNLKSLSFIKKLDIFD